MFTSIFPYNNTQSVPKELIIIYWSPLNKSKPLPNPKSHATLLESGIPPGGSYSTWPKPVTCTDMRIQRFQGINLSARFISHHSRFCLIFAWEHQMQGIWLCACVYVLTQNKTVRNSNGITKWRNTKKTKV